MLNTKMEKTMKKNFFMLSAILMIAMLGNVLTSCSNDDEDEHTFVPGEYDFESNGIYYKVISTSELTCEVVNGKEEYKGDVTIPTTANYSGKMLSVVEIGFKAFYGCSQLTSITIPNTISSIGGDSFTGCYNLKHINIEDGQTILNLSSSSQWSSQWSRALFEDCPLNSLYIGRNLNYKTPPFAYDEYQKELKELTIGNYVTTIGTNMFCGFTNLTKVTIPNSVTIIEAGAFYLCESLKSITLGSSVSEIQFNAFYGCDALTTIYCLNTIPPSAIDFTNNHFINTTVYVPKEALEAYQNVEPWKNFWNLQGID